MFRRRVREADAVGFGRVRRPVLAALGGALIGLAALAPSGALAAPPPADDGPAAPSPSLIPIPPGCPVPEPAAVAFVGVVVDKDGFVEKGTVRYEIEQLRAGSASPYAVDGLIDVRYGPDSKYLEIGERYFVAAAIDPAIGQLASRIQEDQPLFGGDAVIGVDDTAIECPELDDPVQTLYPDGTPIDAGLLDPLFEDRRLLLATIAVPAAVTGLALVALVLLRRLLDLGFAGVFRLGRAAVTPATDVRATRIRAHAPADPDRDNEPLVGGGRAGSTFRRFGAATQGVSARVRSSVRQAGERLHREDPATSDADDDGDRGSADDRSADDLSDLGQRG